MILINIFAGVKRSRLRRRGGRVFPKQRKTLKILVRTPKTNFERSHWISQRGFIYKSEKKMCFLEKLFSESES